MLLDEPILGRVKIPKVIFALFRLKAEEKWLFSQSESYLHFSDPLPVEPSAKNLELSYLKWLKESEERSPHSVATHKSLTYMNWSPGIAAHSLELFDLVVRFN